MRSLSCIFKCSFSFCCFFRILKYSFLFPPIFKHPFAVHSLPFHSNFFHTQSSILHHSPSNYFFQHSLPPIFTHAFHPFFHPFILFRLLPNASLHPATQGVMLQCRHEEQGPTGYPSDSVHPPKSGSCFRHRLQLQWCVSWR